MWMYFSDLFEIQLWCLFVVQCSFYLSAYLVLVADWGLCFCLFLNDVAQYNYIYIYGGLTWSGLSLVYLKISYPKSTGFHDDVAN